MKGLTGLSGLSGVCGGPPAFFTDNFNDGVLDSRWSILGGAVAEQNGRIEIGASGVFGFALTYDFNPGRFIQFKQTTPHSTFFRVYLDDGATYLEMRMQPDNGLAHVGYHYSGSDNWLFVDNGYSGAVWQYLKFEYVPGGAKWRMSYSADGQTWTLAAEVNNADVGGVGRSAAHLTIIQVGGETTFVDDFVSNL